MAEDNSQLTYSKTPVDKTTFVKLRQMDLDAGWLGKFFGGDSSAPANIAGLTVVLLTGCGIVHTFYRGLTESSEFWKMILPVITLALGYLFGKKQKQ